MDCFQSDPIQVYLQVEGYILQDSLDNRNKTKNDI